MNLKLGLSSEEAKKRLATDGENLLAQAKAINPAGIFAGQFKDAMVIILLIAMAVSIVMGEYLDAAAIISVVILNAILGFIQEYRAEKTLEALKKLSAPTAQVYRDGKIVSLNAEKLVRGDVIRLEAGCRIPADCRLSETTAFECDEALLTGESLPISKNNNDACYMGTSVVRGHALAVVVETGQATQMGLISGMLSEVEEERTPLQKKLGELGKIIGLICIIICLIVSVLGIIHGYDVFSMLLTGISLAVAAIPEGLPAVVTISLALAVRRIYKQKALVNKLHSVETLGCANVICTDKTGTLTLNKMKVTQVFRLSDSSGDLIFKCGGLCNNAIKQSDNTYIGDPTEIALMESAESAVFNASGYKRISEIPFDSSTAFMQVTTQSATGDGQSVIDWLKGSLEAVLPKCGGLTPSQLKSIHKASDEMTGKALRSLAFAYRKTGETDFTFIGIQGMSDPLRPEIKKAVKKCKKAGITVVMLTGDHKNTAVEIAVQAGILAIDDGQSATDNCITGIQLAKMSDDELSNAVKKTRVFARVSPGDKLRIVRAFKANGDIVAMTGDGVNDAPAVKEAAIGVAMGIQGTDVTKEAAQLVLLDDNFATLVSAVEQGRTIYSNIRKSMRYMLSSNIGEVLTMLFAMLLGMPVVLLPIQILLINLVTDGFPAIALSVEPATDDVMEIPPRKSSESIFAGGMFASIIARGLAIGICTLCVFGLVLGEYGVSAARTAAMAALGLSQLVFVFECKSKSKGIFNAEYRNNPHLVLAVLTSAVIIFIAMLSGIMSPILQTVPLELNTVTMVLLFASGLPVLNGIGKLFFGK